ncbi:radical SAM protein [Streptomyces sp. NPDC021093]|uniref:radical SAM protein n=1 Tax=Streptomyces sp. NPDC021093 TaxID=3365112 RepID=UPI0037906CA0
MTARLTERPIADGRADFLWLDLTRKCQLSCTHCFNDSGPDRDHGSMTLQGWEAVIDEGAQAGTRKIQFFGGEATLYPGLGNPIGRALDAGLLVEVFTNLVSVPATLWEVFRRPNVTLATSYYSNQADEHNKVTNRPTHARTRQNIITALSYGIGLRVGVIEAVSPEAAERARQDLVQLGVKPERIKVDRVRAMGRGAADLGIPQARESALCGRCADGKAAIGPDGTVTPCAMATWLNVGNVQDTPLRTILTGDRMAAAKAVIPPRDVRACADDDDNGGDDGGDDDECSPGFPGSSCTPRT